MVVGGLFLSSVFKKMSSPNKDRAVLGLVVVFLEFVLGRGSAVSPLGYIMLQLLHIMFLIIPIMFAVFMALLLMTR